MPKPQKSDFIPRLLSIAPLPLRQRGFFDRFTSFPTKNTLVSAAMTARGKENGMNRGYMNNTYRQNFRNPVGRTVPTVSGGASCPCRTSDSGKEQTLAIASVPSQKFEKLYEAGEAFRHGTLFADLDLPYCAGGGR